MTRHYPSLAVLAMTLAFPTLSHADDGVLDKIKSSGTLTLGYRESSVPFSYLGQDQRPVGISMDLCAAVAERVKSEFDLPNLTVDYVAVNASNRIPLIQNGTVDLECGSTTNTAERQQQVAFSVATFVSQPRWMTTTGSGIENASDLKGKTVVITQGSLNLGIGERINQEHGLELRINQAREQAESLLMLRTGRAVAWFEDDILQAGLAASSPDPSTLKFLPDSYGGYYYYGLMMPKDDTAFKAFVDGVIKDLMASGEFEKLYDKWFTQPIPPDGQNLNLPLSDGLRERIENPSDAL
ncbi:MAG: amino acid ABC transporter substrate-binding protein [Flavobacteriaceae bacterium]